MADKITQEKKFSNNNNVFGKIRDTILSSCFFTIAMTVAAFDFGGVATGVIKIAKILFAIFAAMATANLIRKN